MVGYVAHFELVNGFSKTLYMTVEEIQQHAKNYSQSYAYDLRNSKKNSIWSTNFNAMAKKTILKLLLKNWGVKSIEMQQAMQADFGIIGKDSITYPDNDNRTVQREAFDVIPSEEFIEETSTENADEDNPFADTDPETGEILTIENK